MSSIEEQVKLEKLMLSYGITRYKNSVQADEEAGRAADTRYAQMLLREFIEPVSTGINQYVRGSKAGPAAKTRALLRHVDADKAAYFGLRALFNGIIEDMPLQKMGETIGMYIEDELKFTRFHEKYVDYYETIIEDFKRKGTQNYRHMHRVLTHKANALEVKWNDWSRAERMAVGVKIIDVILSTTDLVEKRTTRVGNKTKIILSASKSAQDWIRDYHAYAELLNPDKMPCVIKPDDWTTIDDGGYYTPQIRKRSPMVKTRNKIHKAMFDGDISNITNVINTIQATGWTVNTQVYDVLKQVWEMSLPIGLPRSEPYIIPESPIKGKSKAEFTDEDTEIFNAWKVEARTLHTMERERVSKCFQASRVLKLAKQFQQYDEFWFVYQCDFRGRIYAQCTGFSPQGPDFGKAVLQFADGVRLTEDGMLWLMVHGANTYGYDKVSYEDRVQWVSDNQDSILATAEAPLNTTDFWGNADKPWQFLAFCFEYSRSVKEGIGMITHLPIGLDGSCNGLQNFSAMLRDPVGAAATNLTPSEAPTDIYSEVAAVCSEKLKHMPSEFSEWRTVVNKHGGILPRSLVKRPVMTLPYGSTQQSHMQYIYSFIMDEERDSFDNRYKAATMLTPVLWDSIGSVVVAARQAMDWIRDCAGLLAKENKPLLWWTPIGFPVYQSSKKLKIHRIRTELAGSLQIKVATETDIMDVSKNKAGSSPNFVHSLDACHLMLTCTIARERGIHNFAFIHDDYGTHASNIPVLHECIREAFVSMYEENDPLLDFKLFNEDNSGVELPEPPRRGSLDLTQVLESKYFFG